MKINKFSLLICRKCLLFSIAQNTSFSSKSKLKGNTRQMTRYNVPYRVQFISTEGIIRPISKVVIMLLHFFRSFFLFVTS